MLEQNQIYLGDCLDLMKNIKDKSVDMVLCDLPYGTTYARWDSIINSKELWLQYERIVKDNGAICLFGIEPFSSYLRLSNIKLFRYDWIWHKNKPSGFANAKKQPMRNHEIVSVFYKKQPTYNPIKEERDVTESSAKRNNYKYTTGEVKSDLHNITGVRKERYENFRYPTSIKKFNVVPNAKNKLHSCQKPVDLCEYLIKTYTNEGDLILDNCMGSGSTIIACKNTYRNYIGIEKDEQIYKIAFNRINGFIYENMRIRDCRNCTNSERWEEKYGHEFRYCHLKRKDIEYEQCETIATNCCDYED